MRRQSGRSPHATEIVEIRRAKNVDAFREVITTFDPLSAALPGKTTQMHSLHSRDHTTTVTAPIPSRKQDAPKHKDGLAEQPKHPAHPQRSQRKPRCESLSCYW